MNKATTTRVVSGSANTHGHWVGLTCVVIGLNSFQLTNGIASAVTPHALPNLLRKKWGKGKAKKIIGSLGPVP